MSISNYGELRAAVAAWSNRADLTAVIPDFIRRAHDTIASDVVISAELSFATDTTSQPEDFGRMSSIFIDRLPRNPLTLADALQMEGYSTGAPERYRLSGSTIVVAPAPDQTYTAKALYRILSTFFAADASTNVILTKYPFVYLWGAMAEVGAYLQDLQLASGYEGKFREEIDRINRAERAAVMDGPLQTSAGTSYGVTP